MVLNVFVALSLASAPAVTEVALSNGMRWLLVERHDAPRIGGVVALRAGGVDETKDTAGVAHVLEHLAFAGTPMIGSLRGWSVEKPFHDEALAASDRLAAALRTGTATPQAIAMLKLKAQQLDSAWAVKGDASALPVLYSKRHIYFNAFTSKDETTYVSDLPSEQLRFWLTVEAQRLAAPVFRNFQVERQVVLQELRDRANAADAPTSALLRAAYGDSSGAWAVGGLETTVAKLGPSDLDDFYASFYGPSTAVGCLVGDFDSAAVRPLLEETFGALRASPIQPRASLALLPPSHQSLTGSQASLTVGFPVPSIDDPASAAIDLLPYLVNEVILGGESTESAQRETFHERAALDAVGPLHGPHLLLLRIVVQGQTAAEAERSLWATIDRWLKSATPVTDEALSRAKARWALDNARSQMTRLGQAQAFGHAALHTGRWQSAIEARSAPLTSASVTDFLRREWVPSKAYVALVEVAR